jgi:hypothetical protein
MRREASVHCGKELGTSCRDHVYDCPPAGSWLGLLPGVIEREHLAHTPDRQEHLAVALDGPEFFPMERNPVSDSSLVVGRRFQGPRRP